MHRHPQMLLVLLLWCCFVMNSYQYAHQTETYNAQFTPLTLNATHDLNITAFFAPDYSASTLTNLIEKAQHEVIIAIPGFSSWNGCTSGKECYGCDAADIRLKEKFPFFQALVNAINVRGVTVKILTNDPAQYGDKQCEGKMSLLTFLAIAGAQVKYYTTTSYMHSKFISIDNGEWLSISSINYSKTSIMSNREAGVLIYRNKDITNFTRSTFDYDFNIAQAIDIPWDQYTQSDIDAVRSKDPIPVVVPPNYHFTHCKVDSPAPKMMKVTSAQVTLTVSPDFAYDTMVNTVKKAQKSLQLSIYEVSHPALCDLIIDMASNGIDLKIFVSHEVYGKDEAQQALECYRKLYAANILVKMSHPYCLMYSHQKFWIVDDTIVSMSTGNWRTTDYPQAPYVFPPPTSPDYRNVNRDFTITVSSTNGGRNHLLDTFQTVFDTDYEQGIAFDPSHQSV
jgi:phosphatidylserine/phosphatidylglycerophosphate/cardiolipin synthase-like enzyme